MSGSGTNSNINAGGQRIETRVLAPPGGYSNVSFGGEETQTQKFGGHNFNPKTQGQQSASANSTASITSHTEAAPVAKKAAPVAQQQQAPVAQEQQSGNKNDYRGRGNSSGGGSSSITFG